MKAEEILTRAEKELDWSFPYEPSSFESRLQDIEAEIARLRGVQQKDRPK